MIAPAIATILVRRPEGDPKRLVELFREDANLRLSSPLRGAENANSARSAFCDEKIAAWRNPDQARVVETCGQELRIGALSRAHAIIGTRSAERFSTLRKAATS